MPDEPCVCDHGWICEQHPMQSWPHDDCAGPGMPCLNPGCPFWQSTGTDPVALEPYVEFAPPRTMVKTVGSRE